MTKPFRLNAPVVSDAPLTALREALLGDCRKGQKHALIHTDVGTYNLQGARIPGCQLTIPGDN
jgi:hypothetical protein